jgi:hypothetical protein
MFLMTAAPDVINTQMFLMTAAPDVINTQMFLMTAAPDVITNGRHTSLDNCNGRARREKLKLTS